VYQETKWNTWHSWYTFNPKKALKHTKSRLFRLFFSPKKAHFKLKKRQNRPKNIQNQLKNDRKTSKKQPISSIFTLFHRIVKQRQSAKRYWSDSTFLGSL